MINRASSKGAEVALTLHFRMPRFIKWRNTIEISDDDLTTCIFTAIKVIDGMKVLLLFHFVLRWNAASPSLPARPLSKSLVDGIADYFIDRLPSSNMRAWWFRHQEAIMARLSSYRNSRPRVRQYFIMKIFKLNRFDVYYWRRECRRYYFSLSVLLRYTRWAV